MSLGQTETLTFPVPKGMTIEEAWVWGSTLPLGPEPFPLGEWEAYPRWAKAEVEGGEWTDTIDDDGNPKRWYLGGRVVRVIDENAEPGT